jgi:hypothetical protein
VQALTPRTGDTWSQHESRVTGTQQFDSDVTSDRVNGGTAPVAENDHFKSDIPI